MLTATIGTDDKPVSTGTTVEDDGGVSCSRCGAIFISCTKMYLDLLVDLRHHGLGRLHWFD